jgi:hypothetical protein
MTPHIGTLKVSFHAVAIGQDGQPVDGGQLYGDADTIEGARDFARRVIASTSWRVEKVTIYGREMEFTGDAWRETRNRLTRETVTRTTPLPLLPRDLTMSCYAVPATGYAERHHEIRSDGSCRCGHYPSRYAPAVA